VTVKVSPMITPCGKKGCEKANPDKAQIKRIENSAPGKSLAWQIFGRAASKGGNHGERP